MTNTLPAAHCLYLTVRGRERVMGVIAIALDGERLSSFEYNMVVALIDSSALGNSGPASHRMGYGPLIRSTVGLTGLWQISGRSDTSYRRRVACDVVYVRRQGFLTDLQVLLLTIPAVLAARGAR